MADGASAGAAWTGSWSLKICGTRPMPWWLLNLRVLVAVRDDARALLAAMLQGVEAEKGDFRRVGMTIDGENATLILGTVLKNGVRRGRIRSCPS